MKLATGIREEIVEAMLEQEKELFTRNNPNSYELFQRAQKSLVRGTPMHWMANWPSPYPFYIDRAQGAKVIDVDGNEYTDFCLGDSGAMFGHGNENTAAAIKKQIDKGSTVMLASKDAIIVGEDLQKRFGLPFWQLATSATDANRFAVRLSRIKTGRDKVLVFNGKYHGSLDETQVSLEDGEMVPQQGVFQNAVDFDKTTKIVEFNDIEAVEAALVTEDVACVLIEPVMTNVGVVLPQPGFHEKLREITRRTGTLLIIDETHSISTSPSGYTGKYNLDPDIFVLGKAIAGGIPAAVYGMTSELNEMMTKHTERDNYRISHCGFGGTLAGNVLTVSALRATLENIMTEENYNHMNKMAKEFEAGVLEVIEDYDLPWHVTRIGARVEYMFGDKAPITGKEAKGMRNPKLEAAIHLFLLNRGILITPFHSMALMCPSVTSEDVEKHTKAFRECIEKLVEN